VDAAPGIARTTALTVVTLAAFAGNSILCRLALVDGAIDPVSFTALRLTSGALVLAPFLLHGPRARERTWSARSAAALFAYALGFSLAYVSLDTGTGALLLFGLVQVTMIAAGLRAGERPGAVRTLGIGAAVLGVVLLVAPGVTAPDPKGAVLMAVAGIAWGAYSLFGRGVASPTRATACNFVLAAPAGLLALAARWGSASITTRGALLAIASGAITSGLGYVIWYATLRGHSATSAAVVQLAVPVLAALGGVALLGEEPTLRLAGAGALTLGGVAVAVTARGRLR
jgi:drug/metabolite transporter (DMT)-like permease